MPRKTPIRHNVRDHTKRSGSHVNNYPRGQGAKTVQIHGSGASVLKERQKKLTIDEHKRKLKKIGEKISYLHDGKRVSGVVVGIRAEYYLVERKGQIWKVDRHSIFSVIGGALKGAHARALVAGRAGVQAAKETARKLAPKIKDAAKKGKIALAEKIQERKDKHESDSLAREAEGINWRDWKKDMEKEENMNLERERAKLRVKEETRKYKERISKGPLWQRALKKVGSEVKKELKSKPPPKKRRYKKKKTPKTKTKKKTRTKSKSKTIKITIS